MRRKFTTFFIINFIIIMYLIYQITKKQHSCTLQLVNTQILWIHICTFIKVLQNVGPSYTSCSCSHARYKKNWWTGGFLSLFNEISKAKFRLILERNSWQLMGQFPNLNQEIHTMTKICFNMGYWRSQINLYSLSVNKILLTSAGFQHC